MKWLIKMMSKSNKNKRGFTLIELMVVVIVVGILAAAAIPIYRFALSRAYSSEAKATIGTMATSLRVFAAELSPPVYPTTLLDGKESNDTTPGTDIMSLLGVDTTTNTWWIAGVRDTRTKTARFGTELLATWPGDPITIAAPTTVVGPCIWAFGLGTGTTLEGIQVVHDMGNGEWYIAF